MLDLLVTVPLDTLKQAGELLVLLMLEVGSLSFHGDAHSLLSDGKLGSFDFLALGSHQLGVVVILDAEIDLLLVANRD